MVLTLPCAAAGSRVPSIEDVLQDSSPEHHSCSQPGPPADIYLPGKALGSCPGPGLVLGSHWRNLWPASCK